MLVKTQIVLYWMTVACYVVATCLYISAPIFKKDNYVKPATWAMALGFVPHTVAIGLRWYQTSHFPYWEIYEVYPSYAWGAVMLFLAMVLWRPKWQFTGAMVAPFAFIMIGLGIMGSTEIHEIPRTFFTFWLGVHIAFAKLAYGSALISTGFALAYLYKEKVKDQANTYAERLPNLEKLDFLSYAFAAFSFVMLGIMIISGAIWAYKAWGRYWGWDPIETWALISWLVYGLYLHLRFTYNWQGRKAAYLSVVALVLVIFSFFGIPLFYPSAHEHLKYK